jgi:hypothetical protein
MSNKQALLKAVESLPETANWGQITDVLLDLVARRGSVSDFVRLYRTQFTAEQFAEYLNPRAEHALAAVLSELESQPATSELNPINRVRI